MLNLQPTTGRCFSLASQIDINRLEQRTGRQRLCQSLAFQASFSGSCPPCGTRLQRLPLRWQTLPGCDPPSRYSSDSPPADGRPWSFGCRGLGRAWLDCGCPVGTACWELRLTLPRHWRAPVSTVDYPLRTGSHAPSPSRSGYDVQAPMPIPGTACPRPSITAAAPATSAVCSGHAYRSTSGPQNPAPPTSALRPVERNPPEMGRLRAGTKQTPAID